MTVTPVTLLQLRSGNNSDRPNAPTFTQGQLAINFAAGDHGLYFLDSAGNVRKIGPCQYQATAPNSSPNGNPSNSVGELWVESVAPYYLTCWNGGGWQRIGAAFADVAETANFVDQAQTCILASGAILASGVVGSIEKAQFADLASGAILASGVTGSIEKAQFSNLASGCILASGVVEPVGLSLLSDFTESASGSPVATVGSGLPAIAPVGALNYDEVGSGLYISNGVDWILISTAP